MGNKAHPRFHVPCKCILTLEQKLREKKMYLPGLSRWSDADGSNGFGLIFSRFGPNARGKVGGGIAKFAYCPFCGADFIDKGIILTDGKTDYTGKD